MGRYAGWIALYAGVAGGADAILIPEIPFDLAIVAARLRERDRYGAKFSIVVVAEGAYPKGGTTTLRRTGARQRGRAARRHRRAGVRCAGRPDGQGNAVGRPRPPAARRRADELRSRARDAVRRQGGGADQGKARFGRWWRSIHRTSSRVRLQDVVGKTKTVPIDFGPAADGEGASESHSEIRGRSKLRPYTSRTRRGRTSWTRRGRACSALNAGRRDT